jgi:3-(3-hydroxy-phenyl)propionate hydroxylase
LRDSATAPARASSTSTTAAAGPVNIEFVQNQTVQNKKRMEEKDPAVRAANFDQLRRTVADPVQHRQFLLHSSLIESVRKAALIR